MGPLTTAPMAAQAATVDLGELRTLYETARLLRSRVGRGSQVWGLKNRAARDGEMPHNWGLDVRLGPNAPGVFSQVASDLNATPPGIRKVGSRKVMTVLRSHGLAGSPPSIATDVHLGSSVMAYQLAEGLFDRCKGDGHIPVRLTGMCAGALQGGQGELT